MGSKAGGRLLTWVLACFSFPMWQVHSILCCGLGTANATLPVHLWPTWRVWNTCFPTLRVSDPTRGLKASLCWIFNEKKKNTRMGMGLTPNPYIYPYIYGRKAKKKKKRKRNSGLSLYHLSLVDRLSTTPLGIGNWEDEMKLGFIQN